MGKKDEKSSQEKYITTTEAAKIFDLHPEYAARLAKEAYRRGDPYPVKRGRPYEAPLEAWEKILTPPGKVARKPRKRVATEKGSTQEDPDKGISCSKAARKYGISPSWAARLSKRAQDKCYDWPKWDKGQLIAPYLEWVRIFEDPELRFRKIKEK